MLANFVAGLMIAVTEPLRLGDRIVFEETTGTVEDVTLSYTYLRALSGERIAIPNEKLAAGVLRNDSLGGAPLAVEVSVWIAPGRRPGPRPGRARGRRDRRGDPGRHPARGRPPATSPAERAGAEADLRARCLQALHAEGLLPAAVREPKLGRELSSVPAR